MLKPSRGKLPGISGNRSGLTLLETLVALAILAIGIVGVLQAFSSSLMATREAESYSTAAVLAGQVASQLDRQTSIDSDKLSGTFEDASGYSWEASIESPDSNGLMRTEITVSWGTEARPRHFDMVILLHPSGNTSQSATADGSTGAGS